MRSLALFIALSIATMASGQWYSVQLQSPCSQGACPPSVSVAVVANPACVRVFNWVGNNSETGSGVLVRCTVRYGYVLTAGHIFRDCVGDRIIIHFPDGRRYKAELIRRSECPDLALLKIRRPIAQPLRTIRNWIVVGRPTVAMGYGRSGRFWRRRGTVLGYVDRHMIVSGVTVGGDSGGPVLDAQGNLVGLMWGNSGNEIHAVNAADIHAFLDPVTPPQPPIEGEDSVVVPPVVEEDDPQPPDDVPLPAVDYSGAILDIETRLTAVEAAAPIPGPPGPTGPAGPPGLPGPPGDVATVPPITVNFLDGQGGVFSTEQVAPGGTLNINPILVIRYINGVKTEVYVPLGGELSLWDTFQSGS